MPTLVNADFAQPAVVAAQDYHWVAAPVAGIERVMLDRIGGEQARATSIVRYAAGSHFPEHVHPGGEEILVLSGRFGDAHQDFPAGWYLRNPPGSRHAPFSATGALLFVKLWQMEPDETLPVRVDTRVPAHWQSQDGRAVCHLFTSAHEQVCLQRLPAQAPVLAGATVPVELLVLAGALVMDGTRYPQGSWLRLPAGAPPRLAAAAAGATLYQKTGGRWPAAGTAAWPPAGVLGGVPDRPR